MTLKLRQSSFAPPPAARAVPYRHADGREDPFHWLRDPKYPEVEDRAVLDYLKAENAYVDAVLGGEGDLRPALLEEFKALVIPDDSAPAEWIHGRWYGFRFQAGREYPLWYVKAAPDAAETVILDANREAEGHGFYAVRDWAVSPDHRWLAILDDIDGSERLRLRIRDLASGADVHTAAVPCSPGLGWSSDAGTLFYIRQDDKQRPGDVAWNTANSRNRRIFNDPAGLAAGRNQRAYLVQTYVRDMGNGQHVIMREIDVPIRVRGRHWGGFRTAYKL
ncbi:MAG TPA: hypothetical protein VJ890_14910 [Vineibacter sp.]|nr:hypothetical protein [Vineibacter sp.]